MIVPVEVLDEMHQKDPDTIKVKLMSISPAVNNANMLVDSISKFLTCFWHFCAMSVSRTESTHSQMKSFWCIPSVITLVETLDGMHQKDLGTKIFTCNKFSLVVKH